MVNRRKAVVLLLTALLTVLVLCSRWTIVRVVLYCTVICVWMMLVNLLLNGVRIMFRNLWML